MSPLIGWRSTGHPPPAVRRWAEAGATTVVLQPTDDDPDPEGFIRFVAREVKPTCASRTGS